MRALAPDAALSRIASILPALPSDALPSDIEQLLPGDTSADLTGAISSAIFATDTQLGDVNTVVRDFTGVGNDTDAGTGTSNDTGSDAGTGADTGTRNGTDSGTGTDADTGTVAGRSTDTGADAGTGAETGDIQFEEDMYIYIRARAPNTHVICWSTMYVRSQTEGYVDQGTGIDYTNASVGVHPYRHKTRDPGFTYLSSIRASYPTIISEFTEGDDSTYSAEDIWAYAEANGLSWIHLDMRNEGNLGDGVAHPQEWPVDVWR